MAIKNIARNYFETLRNQLIENNHHLKAGKMLYAPAIKVDGEVFAFYTSNQEMVFRLGSNFNLSACGCSRIYVFNPFKNRSALDDWFAVPFTEKENWPRLALQALEFTRHLAQAS